MTDRIARREPKRSRFPTATALSMAAALLLLVAVAATSASAKTVSEYREEVAHLREDFAALIGSGPETDAGEIARFEAEVFEEIREFANDRDMVSYGGSETSPDNAWILEKWNEYKAGRKGGDERQAIFTYIYERLGAIEGKLAEYEAAKQTGAAKDENKRRLSRILNGEEFRGAPADADKSLVSRFMKWLEEWFRGMFPAREVREPDLSASAPGTLGYVLQILLYVFIAVVIGYLIFRFGPGLVKRFRDRDGSDTGDRIVLGEKIEAGRSTADLFSEAEGLVRDGRLREGLRKGYIALLFGLGEKRRLSLATHKTNRDYLNDLRSTEIHPTMSELTLQYERHWYGAVEAGPDDWARFAGGFDEVLRTADANGRSRRGEGR